jgi:hypothetical protein
MTFLVHAAVATIAVIPTQIGTQDTARTVPEFTVVE